MKKEDLRTQAGDMEVTLRQAYCLDSDFYQELLSSYTIYIWALKSVDDIYPLDKIIDLEEQRSSIEARLPNVPDEEFDNYTVTLNLLAILYEEVK